MARDYPRRTKQGGRPIRRAPVAVCTFPDCDPYFFLLPEELEEELLDRLLFDDEELLEDELER